jgi:hypothetical protein
MILKLITGMKVQLKAQWLLCATESETWNLIELINGSCVEEAGSRVISRIVELKTF